MKTKPAWLKELKASASKLCSDTTEILAGTVKDIDASINASGRVKELSSKTKQLATDANAKLNVTDTLKKYSKSVSQSLQGIAETDAYQSLSRNGLRAKTYLKEDVLAPVDRVLDTYGVKQGARRLTNSAMNGYGKLRAYVKPYYAPETPSELLAKTKDELVYINACILQVSRNDAENLANKLGAAIVSKIAGVTTVGSLLGLVSLFGSAGTGTAIATLSGAAATNATLAWVGSLLGGGMATGAFLTGGVALVVGVGVYKLLGSEARQYNGLSEQEVRIVESTGFLIAAINDILADPNQKLSIDDARELLEKTLKPMHQLLEAEADSIVKNLDSKNGIAFRQHALIDFKKQVIDGFEYFIHTESLKQKKNHPEFVIAGVLYALLTQTAVDGSVESQLALAAIRRVRNDWADAPESAISDVLASFSKEQLQGLANNAKGIYHEMLFVHEYNETHEDTYAEMHEATNHAGSDVVIRSLETDEIISEHQLKAGASDGIVQEHFDKYPDIDVLATTEIAQNIPGCESSGFSNNEITEKMNTILDDIADNTITDRVTESMGLSKAAQAAIQVLNGERNIGAIGGSVLKSAGITGTSTAFVAYLFG